jgi:16S rRNA (guanine527-N7)-methyltransferase
MRDSAETASGSIPRIPGLDGIDAILSGDVSAEPLRVDAREFLSRYADALLAAPYRAVGPREKERVLNEIVLDSLAPISLGLIPHYPHTMIVDMGTGSGIPAIPLGIILPSTRIVGIDGSTKRIAYARDFAGSAGMKRIAFQAVRLEEYGSRLHGVRRSCDPAAEVQQFLGHADVVVARGCAKLPETLALAVSFLKRVGRVLVYTTPRAADEFVPVVLAATPGLWTFKRHPYRRTTGDDVYLILEAIPAAV